MRIPKSLMLAGALVLSAGSLHSQTSPDSKTDAQKQKADAAEAAKKKAAEQEAKKKEAAEKAENARIEARLAAKQKLAAEKEAKRKAAEAKAGHGSMTPATRVPAPAPTFAPGSKEARLADLLQLYQDDKVTPAEYHEQRAKIIAEP